MDLVSMQSKNYDFHLKLLLVGDSDVGKEEMLNCLTDGATASPAIYSVRELSISLLLAFHSRCHL